MRHLQAKRAAVILMDCCAARQAKYDHGILEAHLWPVLLQEEKLRISQLEHQEVAQPHSAVWWQKTGQSKYNFRTKVRILQLERISAPDLHTHTHTHKVVTHGLHLWHQNDRFARTRPAFPGGSYQDIWVRDVTGEEVFLDLPIPWTMPSCANKTHGNSLIEKKASHDSPKQT